MTKVRVEAVFDPTEAAREMGLEMDAERHRIMPDCDWIRWVRREFGKKRLFLYEHLETGRVVLAEWVTAPWETGGAPVAAELESMEPGRTYSSQLPAEYLRTRLVPSVQMAQRMREKMREAAYAKRQGQLLRGEQRAECGKYLRRVGMELEAMNVESGAVDMDFFEDEAHHEMMEGINHVAQVDARVTSVPGISPGGRATSR